ncbi:MAG: cysteine synthase family protein, partial [Acidobacteriota bacterium]
GNTPMVELKRIHQAADVRIFAKLEWFNPGGSVKDRAAWSMIQQGEKDGLLGPGKTIIDATSGNTGISYAMIGAARGYRVRLVMPSNASPERKRILRAYGADLVLTDPLEGSDGAVHRVRELYESDPQRYFYPDQYNNDANWKAHYRTTASEIFYDLQGDITHFVAGRGTSGTFVGTARRLKELDPVIRAITFHPDSPLHGLEGIKHFETSMTPGFYDSSLVDEEILISTELAQRTARRLVREEGLFAGTSSGAALATALQVAEGIENGTIVVIFPDGGDRYLSESFWEEE